MYMCIRMRLFFIPYQDNTTPLYVASQQGHHDVVHTLLGAGADVNVAESDVSHHKPSYCNYGVVELEM